MKWNLYLLCKRLLTFTLKFHIHNDTTQVHIYKIEIDLYEHEEKKN